MKDWKTLDQTYVAHTYGRYPIILERGRGALAYDENGKEYIDLGTGIGVNIFGYGDEIWKEAVTAQLDAVPHASNLYYTEPCIRLAEMLCEKTGMKRVFFGNSGAEANEGAIKAARKQAAKDKGADTYTIITLKDSFHGRTLSTLAATGQDMFHRDYQPLTPGFVYAEPDNLDSVESLIKDHKIAAIMMECIQGEGGVNVLSKEFVQGIQAICDRENILLIVDEVQTGNGRTGAYFSYMNYGIHPNIVTTAKGLGGGLPIGAVLLDEHTKDVFQPGDHGSTFGANPAICAGACSIVSRLDDAFLEKVREKGAYILSEMDGAPGVASVSGMGLMIGIVPQGKDVEDVVRACMEKGVLVLSAHYNKVRLLPPLNIPDETLKKAIGILKEVLAA